jgi:glutamyl-tRNA reductase
MAIVLVGVNHKISGLSACEKVIFDDSEYLKVLKEISSISELQEAVILSTCLRSEVYGVVDRFHSAVEKISEWFFQRSEGSMPSLLIDYDDGAINHLFEVASGLHSIVPGEYEVLGQVKRAFDEALKQKAAGPVLKSIFQAAIKTGRLVRSETNISKGATSIGHLAIDKVAKEIPKDSSIAIIGTGEIAKVAIKRALQTGLTTYVISRSKSRAAVFENVIAISLKELPLVLNKIGALVSASSLENYVINKSMLNGLPQSFVMVDLCMPRSIDPALKELPNVSLYDLSDLESYADLNLALRKQELDKAKSIIEQQLLKLKKERMQLIANPVVTSLVSYGKEIQDRVTLDFASALSRLDLETQELIKVILSRVVNTLMHKPISAVKEFAGTEKQEQLIEAIRVLFDLN